MDEHTYFGFIPALCFDSVVLNLNVTDFDCWKVLISKALGVGKKKAYAFALFPYAVRLKLTSNILSRLFVSDKHTTILDRHCGVIRISEISTDCSYFIQRLNPWACPFKVSRIDSINVSLANPNLLWQLLP